MSSILDELRKKREQERQSYLDNVAATQSLDILNTATSASSYKDIMKEDKERQKQLKELEKAIQKLRTPTTEYGSDLTIPTKAQTTKSNNIEEITPTSRSAGDTELMPNSGIKSLGPNLISGLGKAALTAETTKDVVVSDVANTLAGIRGAYKGSVGIGTINAEDLWKYANGSRDGKAEAAYTKLIVENSSARLPNLTVLLDEINRGVYKGSAEDIKKTLQTAANDEYSRWYTQKIAPSVNRANESLRANTMMYGGNEPFSAGNVMNFAANTLAKVGEFAGGATVAGPIAAGGLLGLSEGGAGTMAKIRNGYTLGETARDTFVDTAKGAAFAGLFKLATPFLNAGINPSVTGLARFGQSLVNGFLTAAGITTAMQAVDHLKKDPDFDFIDWNEFERGVKDGTYQNLQDYTNSDEFKKHVTRSKASQILISSIIAAAANTYRIMTNMSINENRLVTAEEAAKFNPKRLQYLKTLGLEENATNEEIKAAYRSLAKKYHPDNKLTGNENMFKQVNDAYNELVPKPALTQFAQEQMQNQQNTSNIVPVTNEPTTPTQSNVVTPPPSTYTPSTSLTSATNNNIINSNQGGIINGEKNLRTNDGTRVGEGLGTSNEATLSSGRLKSWRDAVTEEGEWAETRKEIEGKEILDDNKLSEKQISTRKKFQSEYGVPIRYYENLGKTASGFAIKAGYIFLNDNLRDDGVDFVSKHELAELVLKQAPDEELAKLDDILDLIMEDDEALSKYSEYKLKGKKESIKKYYEQNKDKMAKEVLCDINALDTLPEKDIYRNVVESLFKKETIEAAKKALNEAIENTNFYTVPEKSKNETISNSEPGANFPTDMSSKQMLERYSQLTNGRKIDYKAKEVTLADGTKMPLDDYNNEVNKLRKVWESKVDDVKELQGENSTQGSFSMPKNLPEELPAERRKFLKEFKQVGYVNIKGVKVTSVDDLADVAQVFRDPIAETFRVIFMKGDTIVGQSGYTTGSVRAVGIGNNKRFAGQIDLWADGFGADSYYLIHNHPDGRVEPSSGDINATKNISSYTNIPLKGHIVIDHNEFSAIYRDGTTQKHIKLRNNTYNEIEKDFSKEGWANTPASNVDKIAALSSYVKNDKDFSTVIWTNSNYVPTVLQSLPNSFFEGNNKNKIVEYMQKVGRENGADYVMFATQSQYAFGDFMRKGPNAAAVLMYSANQDGSLKIVKAGRSHQLHLYNNSGKNLQQIAPMEGVQMQEPPTSLEEIKKQYEPKQPEVKKELPKKLEPKKKEQPTKVEKKQPPKRLEKKQPEPDKRLGFDKVDKEKEALEKANNQLRDELAKQKKEYEERLKKKDEALEKFKQTKKEQKEKQKLKLKKKEEQKKEEQRFKSATPKGKLRMLGRKIEKQTGYYEINNFPQLDETYEKEFGNTIRQTIKTLKTRDVFPYLPSKVQDIVNAFADETYLKANWKTFDKYVKEALQIKELKDLVEKSDTPVAKRLLSVMQEHKSAPITIKNAKEMYDDLQILADIVELAQERLDYRRQPENWEKVLDKSAEALEELEKTNTPKKLTPKSAKLEKNFDNFKKLPETFQTLKTRIQAAFGGNPNSPLKTVWDWFEEGREREAMLDSKFAENFDGLVEKAAGGWKFAGELEEDFADDAPYIDAGITGTNPKTGKPYEENAKLPKDIIMHIVASSRNDDNLMSFCKILLGTDYQGNPVYSNPGGYIVPNEYYMKRGKIGEAYEKGKKYVFTKKDIEHLEGMLTETEKKFVEAALRVGGITAQYGNEVSQKLIGRDLFSVIKNYIRIIRDLSTFDGELIDPARLDNLANATSDKYVGIGGILGRGGSLEGRNHRSTRPIYGESLKQSVENSFAGAKKYIAYALPLYDTDYILEGRLPDKFEQVEVVDKEPKSTPSLKYVKVDEPPRNGADRTMYYVDNGDSYTVYKVAEKGKTMRQLLTNAGEEGFYDYYKQFVDGLVGRNKKYSKFASTRARVVFNANLRVAATQFFSYFQEGQFLNHPISSMTKALADRGTIFKLAKEFLESKDVDTSKLKGQRLVNRFIEYVTYTNTQRGLGKFSDDVRYVEAGSTVLGRINTGKLLATVDKFTVDATFRALMYDIMADGTKFGSEEFFKQFKSRLYSIYQSNPQYSAIYRTPLQNKGTAISTALSQFQTVMLQGFNNASQAAMAHEYYKKQGNESEKKKWGKVFKRTVSGLIISSLTLVALRDYLDQLAGKEKDEPYVKRITMSFIQNMLAYTIVGDEIFSAWFKFNNYDLTTNELSYFNTALDAIGDMGTFVTKPTPPNAIKLIKSLGQTIGLPTGNIENAFGIISNLTPDNAFKTYSVMKDKNKYEKWLKNQDAIGTDFKTFYEISQAVKEKTLTEKYGYVKGSDTGTYGSLSYAKGRAIMDVLGIEQGKKMTKEQKQAYAKWYNIFKD